MFFVSPSRFVPPPSPRPLRLVTREDSRARLAAPVLPLVRVHLLDGRELLQAVPALDLAVSLREPSVSSKVMETTPPLSSECGTCKTDTIRFWPLKAKMLKSFQGVPTSLGSGAEGQVLAFSAV